MAITSLQVECLDWSGMQKGVSKDVRIVIKKKNNAFLTSTANGIRYHPTEKGFFLMVSYGRPLLFNRVFKWELHGRMLKCVSSVAHRNCTHSMFVMSDEKHVLMQKASRHGGSSTFLTDPESDNEYQCIWTESLIQGEIRRMPDYGTLPRDVTVGHKPVSFHRTVWNNDIYDYSPRIRILRKGVFLDGKLIFDLRDGGCPIGEFNTTTPVSFGKTTWYWSFPEKISSTQQE